VKTASELFVNLRCMQLKNKQALVYVGGGVTKDSNPELEWEETVNKTQTMMSVL
jgi:isochorismate synthase